MRNHMSNGSWWLVWLPWFELLFLSMWCEVSLMWWLVWQHAKGICLVSCKQPGCVLPSILVVYGVHARLEDISEEGRWVRTHAFTVEGREVRRTAGEKVPAGLLGQWRTVRRESQNC